jgi:hypothetical protein
VWTAKFKTLSAQGRWGDGGLEAGKGFFFISAPYFLLGPNIITGL